MFTIADWLSQVFLLYSSILDSSCDWSDCAYTFYVGSHLVLALGSFRLLGGLRRYLIKCLFLQSMIPWPIYIVLCLNNLVNARQSLL